MPEYLAKLLSSATSNPYDHALAGFIGGIISGAVKHISICYALTSGLIGAVFALFVTTPVSIKLGVYPSMGVGFVVGLLAYIALNIIVRVDWVARFNRTKK
jgi:hypothetical protein